MSTVACTYAFCPPMLHCVSPLRLPVKWTAPAAPRSPRKQQAASTTPSKPITNLKQTSKFGLSTNPSRERGLCLHICILWSCPGPGGPRNWSQVGSKRRAQMAGWPQAGPGLPQDGPTRPQDGPKMAPGNPKRAPRSPKFSRKRPQDDPIPAFRLVFLK